MAFTLLGFSMNNAMELSLNTSSSISPFLQHTNANLRMEVRLNRPKSFSVTRMRSSISCCSSDSAISATPPFTSTAGVPRMIRKRRRYRKLNPGEKEGITEEMRFVAMKLRNVKGKKIVKEDGSNEEDNDEGNDTDESTTQSDSIDDDEETWQPSLEGFVKYLVDSQIVFNTIERIVDESSDVSYVYFRKTGLERSEALSEDLEWLREQEIEIPEPSSPGITYAKYLEELAETSAPLFLSHFYNIYFAHIAGGQVIAKKVSKKILEGKELKFTNWGDGDVEECLKGVREKLNMLGEHWQRDDKNKCLREATKSFRYQGQIIRHIIL